MPGRGTQPELVEYGDLVLNFETYQAALSGKPLDLTYMEYELLKFFATHPAKVFTREQLLSRVWGYEYYGGARTVDVHVRRLRAKLGEEHANLIQTVRSVGYRFGQTRPGAVDSGRAELSARRSSASSLTSQPTRRAPRRAAEHHRDRAEQTTQRPGLISDARPSTLATLPTRGRYGPGFDLDFGAAGERGDLHGRAGRSWSPNASAYTAFIAREVAEVGDEHRGLGDVGERSRRSRRAPRRCCRAPGGPAPASPSTNWPVAGSSGTWPASTSQSPARTAGEYGPATGGALGVGTGATVIAGAYERLAVPDRGEGLGPAPSAPVSAFHAAAATAANDRVRTASQRAVRDRRDDLDVDRRHRPRRGGSRTNGS